MEDRRRTFRSFSAFGGRSGLGDRIRRSANTSLGMGKNVSPGDRNLFRDLVGGRAGRGVLFPGPLATMAEFLVPQRMGGIDRRVAFIRLGARLSSFPELEA